MSLPDSVEGVFETAARYADTQINAHKPSGPRGHEESRDIAHLSRRISLCGTYSFAAMMDSIDPGLSLGV